MKKALALSLEPQNINQSLWYYEEPKGITIVQEFRLNGDYIKTTQTVIPWRKILASVERYKKSKK